MIKFLINKIAESFARLIIMKYKIMLTPAWICWCANVDFKKAEDLKPLKERDTAELAHANLMVIKSEMLIGYILAEIKNCREAIRELKYG